MTDFEILFLIFLIIYIIFEFIKLLHINGYRIR